MILVGFPDANIDNVLIQEIKTRKVGGIIIFEKNIPKMTNATPILKKMISAYQTVAPIPLFISIDQEGGQVNRLKPKYGFPKSITAQAIGKLSMMDSIVFYAQSIGNTLATVGINVNFAPVVDIGINKENPVIYKNGRAFSANPDSVMLLAKIFIDQHRRAGVISVIKHFPGHGSSNADTHLGIADVTNTWTKAELIPYQKLLAVGRVDAIMSAHIVHRQLDPQGYPGTLSHRMIDSLLRKKMGYQGVVFSDDMQMQAIVKQYGLSIAIQQAINAGIDILCFSNNLDGSEKRSVDVVHQIIKNLVLQGQIESKKIDVAYHRIMKLKSTFLLFNSKRDYQKNHRRNSNKR